MKRETIHLAASPEDEDPDEAQLAALGRIIAYAAAEASEAGVPAAVRHLELARDIVLAKLDEITETPETDTTRALAALISKSGRQ